MNLDPAHRIAGVLVPIFALRATGDLGIGDAVSLMDFIDWAACHRVSCGEDPADQRDWR